MAETAQRARFAHYTHHQTVPRTRGDEPRKAFGCVRDKDPFPARAGMTPISKRPAFALSAGPRTRGDEQAQYEAIIGLAYRSPHARGMNRIQESEGIAEIAPFNARAGMLFMRAQALDQTNDRSPHARG